MMNVKLAFAAVTLALTTHAYGYEGYSVFSDAINQDEVLAHTPRLVEVAKQVGDTPTVGGAYRYDEQGRVTQRDYADSTFDYHYDADGRLASARALMKHGDINSYVRHTKENFVSEYHYDTDGKVVKEMKRIFDDFAISLDQTPRAAYKIKYRYDEQNRLVKRTQIPLSGDDMANLEFHYRYHDDGRLRKIIEIKKRPQREKSVLLLQYHDNGEIRTATQTLFGKGTQVFELEYVADPDQVYGIYYVDPVKEWKVDMDFFGLAFHPIQSIKKTVANQVTQYQYRYVNDESDRLPDSLTLTLTQPSGASVDIEYRMTNQP
ncbi:hypothetical protein [Vibrio ostreicida]|uniref:hypothetical protein n=2 Tax=Vibrio ostreicida TaxID=526588 RepID=UPI001FE95364|nr:hypothetical protein [Vibrio ostreicida]